MKSSTINEYLATEPTQQSYTVTVTTLAETSVGYQATTQREYTATFQSTPEEGPFTSIETEEVTFPDKADVNTDIVVPTNAVDYSTTKQNMQENISSDIISTVDSLNGQNSSDSATFISSDTIISSVSPSGTGFHENGSTLLPDLLTSTLIEHVPSTSNGVLEQTNHTNGHSTDKMNTPSTARRSEFSSQGHFTSFSTNSKY